MVLPRIARPCGAVAPHPTQVCKIQRVVVRTTTLRLLQGGESCGKV